VADDTPEHSLEIVDGSLPRGARPVGLDGFGAPLTPPADGYEVHVPGGAFAPLHVASENRDWTSAVDESKVLCFSCVHGWIMWKHAATRNTKPDGSAFIQREGYCLFPAKNPGGGPLPLQDRFVLKCNQYIPCEQRQTAVEHAMQPKEKSDDDGS